MSNTEIMQNQVAKAAELKAKIDTLRPVTDWKFSSRIWTGANNNVRVYVNDKKGKTAAVLIVHENCTVTPEWQAGHSMTRNEISAVL